jgi:hypothetical protein
MLPEGWRRRPAKKSTLPNEPSKLLKTMDRTYEPESIFGRTHQVLEDNKPRRKTNPFSNHSTAYQERALPTGACFTKRTHF